MVPATTFPHLILKFQTTVAHSPRSLTQCRSVAPMLVCNFRQHQFLATTTWGQPPSAVLRAAGPVLFALVVAVLAPAQTVRPLINELSNPAKGRVEYVNDSFTPLNVVLEAKS